jgi:DNA-directed RNA polymerase subunit RPC12/RpoP
MQLLGLMPIFSCHICRTSLTAEDSQAGQLVRCPTCLTTLRVPAGQAAPQPPPLEGVAAAQPRGGGLPPGGYAPPQFFAGNMASGGRRYGFNCAYCSSRLEANEAMAAQEGQCPTCGNNITIPILDRYGRLIDPRTRQIIKPDPHPVHAYAAAGERAPAILRDDAGKQLIRCPRGTCGALSPISANNCKVCGMPFTMEGTTVEAAGTSNGFCVASMVLGIIGLLTFCVVVPSLLAVVFGLIGINQVNQNESQRSGKGMGFAGIILGIIGMAIFVRYMKIL